MFCKNCGKEIADNAKFCEHCGAQLVEDENENDEHCLGCPFFKTRDRMAAEKLRTAARLREKRVERVMAS